MAIGPVQLIVLAFNEPNFQGEVLAELDRLKENDVVRVIDAIVVHKDAEGDLPITTDVSNHYCTPLIRKKSLPASVVYPWWYKVDQFKLNVTVTVMMTGVGTLFSMVGVYSHCRTASIAA